MSDNAFAAAIREIERIITTGEKKSWWRPGRSSSRRYTAASSRVLASATPPDRRTDRVTQDLRQLGRRRAAQPAP
jgi:hypothetical protein